MRHRKQKKKKKKAYKCAILQHLLLCSTFAFTVFQFRGESHCMWHVTVSTCRGVRVSYTGVLVRSAFVMLSRYASMYAARLVVCLLFVCVGGVVSAEGELEKDTIVLE